MKRERERERERERRVLVVTITRRFFQMLIIKGINHSE
jgi:hypothetical protein